MESGTNGWTSVDNTSLITPKFHLDTYLAYEGTYSWWCGELNPGFTGGDGYGNSWDQRLEIPPTDLSGAAYPILTYAYRHDSEPEYDFTYVQAESNGVYINLNRGYDGSSGGWQDLGLYGFTLSGYDNPLKARFRFVSDGAWSDEDGIYNSNGGAFHCDNVKVFDYYGGYVHFYDDGESGGLCVPSHPSGSGDWWHIIDRECSAYSGTHSWWCGDDADTSRIPPSLSNSLISPPLDLSGVLVCTVRMAVHFEVPTTDDDYAAFAASNDSGANWVNLGAWWGDFGECEGWASFHLDRGFDIGANGLLPADELLFRITMHTTDNGCGPGAGGGAGIMVDDFTVLSYVPPVIWHVPGDVPTIQAALDSASTGHTVLVAAGIYSPSTRGESFPLVMKSGVELLSESGANATVLDAEGGARVLSCVDNTSDTMIEGFTLTGGSATEGGGVYCNNASPELLGCLLVGNSATAGGGLYADSSSGPALTNCTLVENSADAGCGVFSDGGSDVDLLGCIIAYGGTGAAVECSGGGSAELNFCDVYGNEGGDWADCIESQWEGGNISWPPGFCDREAGDYRLCSGSPCLDYGITIGAFGEGCESLTWAVPADAPTIQAAIDFARAYDTVSIDCGTYYEHDLVLKPGMSLESASGEADCVTIDAGGLGRVLRCYDSGPDASIAGITFTGGSADYGGAVMFTDSSLELTRCLFTDNEAEHGGGGVVFMGGSYVQIADCTFYRNSAPDATIALEGAAESTIYKSIVAFGTEGAAVSCVDTSQVGVWCTDIYGNAGGDWTGCIASQAGGGNNISEDPLFVDAPGGDLHVLYSSPCVGGPCGTMGALGPVVVAEPTIAEAADVLGDQGGFVTISWARSSHENDPDPPTIVDYEIYRRQASRVDGWDLVGSVPADGSWLYESTVATLCDSTPQQGICWSTFLVRATTPFPASYFDSEPDSCYSVDNLAPDVPGNVHAVLGSLQVTLSWDANSEPDFDEYAVYRDTVPGFPLVTPLASTPTEGYLDTDLPPVDAWWYVVTAFDINGNESEPHEVSIVDDPPGAPQGLHAYGDTTLVSLIWRPNEESDFHRYSVYRDTVSDVATETPLGYALTEFFEDPDPPDSPMWWYVVTAWDYSGKESEPSLPDSASTLTGVQDGVSRLALRHASPNPFNPMTSITYELPEDALTELSVYDASGKLVRVLVRKRDVSAGVHHVIWDGRDGEGRAVASGVYFYRLQVGDEVLTKRMVMLK
jgi:hypothetical protein